MKLYKQIHSHVSRLSLPQRIGMFVVLFLLVLSLPLTIVVLQHQQQTPPQPQQTQQPTQQQATGTSGTYAGAYAANIEYDPNEGYGTYNATNLASPTINAIDINMNWSAVEPEQGVFNWAPADNAIAAWAGNGKKFVLVLRYIHEVSANSFNGCNDNQQYLPTWEIARIPTYCDFDKNTVIPDYFDPRFKADLKAYVQAVADHIANSPYHNNLAYVRVGMGVGGEGFYLYGIGQDCGTGNDCDFQTDKQQLITRGYTPQNWAAWQEEMLTAAKNAFSYAQLIYPLVQQDTDPTTGQPVDMEVAYWAAAHGIGVGEQGLAPTNDFSYAKLNVILPYIHTHYPQTYIQFQTVAGVRSARTIQGDIQTAEQYGACSIEWYANVAANPAYQSLFVEWQQYVNSNCKAKTSLHEPDNLSQG